MSWLSGAKTNKTYNEKTDKLEFLHNYCNEVIVGVPLEPTGQ